MPKDARTIHGAIRAGGGQVFTAGREDELEQALSPAEIQRLTGRGLISGFTTTADADTEKSDSPQQQQETAKPKKGK